MFEQRKVAPGWVAAVDECLTHSHKMIDTAGRNGAMFGTVAVVFGYTKVESHGNYEYLYICLAAFSVSEYAPAQYGAFFDGMLLRILTADDSYCSYSENPKKSIHIFEWRGGRTREDAWPVTFALLYNTTVVLETAS